MSAYKNSDLANSIKELEIINNEDVDVSLKEAETSKLPLHEILLRKGALEENTLGKIVADLISLPFVNLTEVSIPDDVLNIIPEHVARAQKVMAYEINDTTLKIAATSVPPKQLLDFLTIKTDKEVQLHFTLDTILAKALTSYGEKLDVAFAEIIQESVNESKHSKDPDPPIIKIVSTIIDYAFKNNASDVHIEPLEAKTLVRFRIDGMLHNIVELPLELSTQIVTRVKVMANLRTDEHQEPQDGKLVYQTNAEITGRDEELDIRVSIAAITRGEKIVMRLLSERAHEYSLSDLGLSDSDLEKVERAYTSPNGLILATGPTGSGKTTTLYTILKLINKPEINIMTIEDPVEYEISHVNQIQVNENTELTFAKGLRSIVRQDPDVILVGEIRDDETADIAINSAMTGHLVLSTLHTNDASTTFPRLIDMKVEPYLVASTVRIIIAQRLVRMICNKCKVSMDIAVDKLDKNISKFMGKEMTLRGYQGKGCKVCNQTGYSGRIGIYEVIEMEDSIRDAVTAKKTSIEIEKLAIKNGMTTMLGDGVAKVKAGITTIDEILRVTKDS